MRNESGINRVTHRAEQVRTSPDPMEAYHISQGFSFNGLVVVSGQASINLEGEIVGEGDFEAQAEQTFKNLEAVLKEGGSSLEDVVKVTIYVTDMSQFPKVVALREKYFTKPYPADTIVEVSALALPELMIEIEAMALVSS